MKAKFLLTSLALSAAFVACNNEDILVNETVGANEVVGAKLLGSGLTMNIGNGSTDSRATADNWENGDVAGVAWVTDGYATTSQTGVALSNVENTVWANHFYQYNDGAWATRSNVYEGWHFAYLPYQHQKKAGQLVVEVNGKPMTKADHEADVMDNAPKISAAEFLNEDNVDVENGSIDVTFDIKRYVNVIKPKLIISEDFTGHEDLNTIGITSITVLDKQDDKRHFYKNVSVNPAKLPQIQYKKYPVGHAKEGQYILVDGKKQYDDEATLALLNYANLYTSGAIVGSDNVNSITTEIDGEHFVLNGDKTVRMFLAPKHVSYTAFKENIQFIVNVEGGHFTVKYTAPVVGKTLTPTQEKNNAAIKKMVELMEGTFKTDAGKTRSLKTITTAEGTLQAAQTIEMALSLENFEADYIIKDIDDWNGSVKLANALGEENPKFTLAADAEVKFTEEILAPANGVQVVGNAGKNSKLIIDGDLTWNNNVKIDRKDNVNIIVNEGKSLSLVNCVLLPYRLSNYGVIYVDGLSTIGHASYNSFIYNNRVEVEYGAYVYPAKDGIAGPNIIAYNVDGSESAAKINTLIATSGSQNGYAKVNTLIIENNVALDLTKKDDDNVDNDRYHGSTQFGNELADMTNVAIEMNGGTIKSALYKVKNVHNVTIKGGDNTIKDIDVMGNLVVEAGSVTVDATEYTVEKIVAGNKVYENVKDAANVTAIVVNEDATLNVTVDTYTSTIINDGSINVASPYVLRYANTIEQSGSQSGKIVKGALALAEAIAAGGEITLMKDYTITEALTITENVTIDLNGKTITSAGDVFDVKEGTLVITGNGTVNAGSGDAYVAVWANGGDVVIENGTFTVGEDGTGKTNDCIYAKGGTITVNGGTFENAGTYDPSNGGVVINAHNTIADSFVIINGGTFKGQSLAHIYENDDVTANRVQFKKAHSTFNDGKIVVE